MKLKLKIIYKSFALFFKIEPDRKKMKLKVPFSKHNECYDLDLDKIDTFYDSFNYILVSQYSDAEKLK